MTLNLIDQRNTGIYLQLFYRNFSEKSLKSYPYNVHFKGGKLSYPLPLLHPAGL